MFSLTLPAKKHPTQHRCIFCLQEGIELTDEHVIPYALSGTGEIIIEKASCAECQAYCNRNYENPVLQRMFLTARLVLNLKRRKKGLKPLPPVTILKRVGGKLVPDREVDVAPNAMPFSVLIPKPPRASLITGDAASESQSCQVGVYGTDPTAMAGIEWQIESEFNLWIICQFIAKIAYCHAVGELGLGGFDGSSMRDLLLGKREDVFSFVGCVDSVAEPALDLLHQLTIHFDINKVIANVQLFATMGTHPVEVYVGERLV